MKRGERMFDLKQLSEIGRKQAVKAKDREVFATIEFDPNELKQLKNMDEKELQGLLMFCGIRSFNGIPSYVLEENEMRMAFVLWRAEKIKEKKEAILPKLERGIKWTSKLMSLTKQ